MATAKVSGIYEIVNLVNGKRYVGSSVDLRRRRRVHFANLRDGRHHSRRLQAAWNKHGPDAFEFRIIVQCDPLRLLDEEQAAFDRLQPAYNMAPTAGNVLGFRLTDEQRAKLRGRKRSREAVERTAAAHRGSKRSDETKAKIAAKARGRKRGPRTEAHKAALSAALSGKAKSPEHIAALQAGRARRVYTDAQRAALGAAIKAQYADGRRSKERPQEYRDKIAASLMAKRAKD